jgi:hypothetical protein
MTTLTAKEQIIRHAAILLGAKILRERQQAKKKHQSTKRKGTRRC